MKGRKCILEIGNQSEVLYLTPDNILCIVADGNYCDIYLADGEVLKSVCFQRAEIARMIDRQLPHSEAEKFALVGRSYIINVEHIQRINIPHQQLTFDIFSPGTGMKLGIHASAAALRNLREALNCSDTDNVRPIQQETGPAPVIGGFTEFIAAPSRKHVIEEKEYEINDDDVIFLG